MALDIVEMEKAFRAVMAKNPRLTLAALGGQGQSEFHSAIDSLNLRAHKDTRNREVATAIPWA